MPIPVSTTLITTPGPATSAERVMSPAGLLNFTAFARRFTSTWWIRFASRSSFGIESDTVTVRRMLRSSAQGQISSTASWTTDAKSVRSRSSWSLPVLSFPRSRSWFTRLRRGRVHLDVLEQRGVSLAEHPRRALGQPFCRPGDDGERRPEIVGDRREEVLLEGIQLPEPGRHPVEGVGEVGDLVVPPDGNGLGELAPLDRPGRGSELAQGARDPEAGEESDRERHGQAGHDRDERHETALFLEASGLPPASAQLGVGLSVELLDQRLELHRGLLDARPLGRRTLAEPPVAAKLFGCSARIWRSAGVDTRPPRAARSLSNGSSSLDEEPDVGGVAKDRMARFQATKRGDSFQEAHL